jgi:tryptophan synthase alpha chain
MLSSSSTTGVRESFTEVQRAYFERIKTMRLRNPTMIGFGISNRENYNTACQYAGGAIIGSAFVRMLGEKGASKEVIRDFVNLIK